MSDSELETSTKSLNLSDPEGLQANSTGINPGKTIDSELFSPVKNEIKTESEDEFGILAKMSIEIENSDDECKSNFEKTLGP